MHWRVAEQAHPAFPKQLNSPWERLSSVEISETKIPTFGLEDTFLVLSAHAAKHAWGRLRWICDLAELIRTNRDLDWDDILGCAREAGPIAERTLLTSVLLSDRLLNAGAPAELLAADNGYKAVRATTDQVSAGLAKTSDDWPMWWPRSFETDHQFLAMLDGPLARVRYFARFGVLRVSMPDAKDRAAVDLPSGLDFLYYLSRPFRMFREYGLRPAAAFGGLVRDLLLSPKR